MRYKTKEYSGGRAAARRRGRAAAFITALLLFIALCPPLNAAKPGADRATCFARLDGGENAEALWDAISALCPDAEYLYGYEIALDGFSFTVDRDELHKLNSFGGVVFWEANTYGAPEPEDKFSSSLIGADTETLEKYRGEGMVIAVIDVGFDTGHEIFTLADEKSAKISSEAVAAAAKRGLSVSNWLAYEASSPYVSVKIPFAYDYYYQTTIFTGTADHGDHVAAIAAGNAAGATDPNAADGVAPEAQLLLMNVGDKNGDNLNDANIYAALEDAIRLGADVINISLGRVAGFGNIDMTGEGYERVVKRAYALGIDVVCSAGNNSRLGMDSNLDNKYGITQPLAASPDYSVLSAPGCFPRTFTAAASVNSGYVLDDYISGGDGVAIAYNPPANSDFTKVFGGKTLEYVAVPGLGEPSDYKNIDVFGKLALISRGTITFAEKLRNAEAAGAAGALVYDNTDSADLVNMAVDDGSVPCAAISRTDGLTLAGRADKTLSVVTGANLTMPAPHSGEMADYSSWGVTSDLRLKPDITAPGSYIYSAVSGGYATMSGTSMAAPHIAGALAVIKQYIKTLDTHGLTEEELLALPRALLASTAQPSKNKNTAVEYSPRLQGAGLADLAAATGSAAYAYCPDTLEAKLELGDGIGETYKLTFTVRNLTDSALDYYVEATAATDSAEYIKFGGGGDWFITGDPAALISASIKLEGGRGAELNARSDKFKRAENIHVPARSAATYTLAVTLDKAESAELDKIFTSGWYIDGFIKLTARDGGNSDLSLPYMGFAGDWSAVGAFDFDGEFYSDLLCTGVIRGDTISLYELGLNILGSGEIRSEGRYIISVDGDGIFDFIGLKLNLLRNCTGGLCYVTDSSGAVVYKSGELGLLQKAYYDLEEAILAESYINLLWDGSASDNSRYKYPDGVYTLTIEVYTEGGGVQKRAFNFTVDTEKPALDNYYFIKKNGRIYLHLTASDNTYLASLCVYEAASVKDGAAGALDETRVYEADTDSSAVTEEIDVTDYLSGNKWLYVELVDYAFNMANFRVPTAGYGG